MSNALIRVCPSLCFFDFLSSGLGELAGTFSGQGDMGRVSGRFLRFLGVPSLFSLGF